MVHPDNLYTAELFQVQPELHSFCSKNGFGTDDSFMWHRALDHAIQNSSGLDSWKFCDPVWSLLTLLVQFFCEPFVSWLTAFVVFMALPGTTKLYILLLHIPISTSFLVDVPLTLSLAYKMKDLHETGMGRWQCFKPITWCHVSNLKHMTSCY